MGLFLQALGGAWRKRKNQMRFTTGISSFTLILIVFLSTLGTVSTNLDDYLLSCGASSTVDASTQSFDRRTWNLDENSTFATGFSSTTAASATPFNEYGQQIPFSRARIFMTDNFTYSFPVSPGPKFIRLLFYPSAYSTPSLSLSSTDPYLTVKSNSGHLLLHNFSAYLSLSNSSADYVQKEFYVNANSPVLQLTFSPTPPSSYAFVNGIEIVSVPENLYIRPNSLINVDIPSIQFPIGNSTGLETAYRANVGGSDVSPSEDVGNMYRLWMADGQFLPGFEGDTGLASDETTIKYTALVPNYSAPAVVYQSFRWMGKDVTYDFKSKASVMWAFEVDLGFHYLVRLHWCDVVVDINSSSYEVFDVYLDQVLAEAGVDVYKLVGQDTTIFHDYVVFMEGGSNSSHSRGFLQLALQPNLALRPATRDILLNGLEIFKISRPDGSLDAPNPNGTRTPNTPPIDQTPFPRRKSPSHVIPGAVGAVTGAILLTAVLCYFLFFRRRKWSKTSGGSSGTNSTKSKLLFSFEKSTATTKRSNGGGGSSLPSHLCRHFSLAEIRLATSDFSQSLIIGHGGFGNVYKGTVNTDTGPTTVAIKRLNPLSGQGAREFTTEIELLSKLRHVHLVSLIGYCDDAGEMILVYEFMSRGTLREHLYPNSTGQMMPWCQRLQACVGAARGIHYLHTRTERMIIHRDVKSTNILVDESWVAKVSDFGLSKLGPVGGELSHVSTHVKGSFGYVDPEYYRRQQLTEKSDVYSFGVVLFEVLCGRAAVNPSLPKEQVNLRIWARKNQLSGTLDTIVDPNLKGQIAPECLRKFGEVAESCVRDEGANRPSMVDVIWGLEFALQLQLESAANTTVNGDYKTDTVYDENVATTNMGSPITDTSARLIRFSEENSNWSSINNSSSGLFSNTTLQGGDGGSTDVFSQIFKPEGR